MATEVKDVLERDRFSSLLKLLTWIKQNPVTTICVTIFAILIYAFVWRPEVGFSYVNKYAELSKMKIESERQHQKEAALPIAQKALNELREEVDARLCLLVSVHNNKTTNGGFPLYYADYVIESLRPHSGIHSHKQFWVDVRIDDDGAFSHIWRQGGSWFCTHEELDRVDSTNQFNNSPNVDKIKYEIIWGDVLSKQDFPVGMLIMSFDQESNLTGKNLDAAIGKYRIFFREALSGYKVKKKEDNEEES